LLIAIAGAVMMMDMDDDKILAKLSGEPHKKNIRFLLMMVGRDKLELMRKTGTLEKIGSQNIYETTRLAVSHAQSRSRAA
jgi:hypothetical protein